MQVASFDDAGVLHASRVVEKSTGAGILNSVGDRARLLVQAVGSERCILVKQFQGELSGPWIGRVKG